VVNPGQFDLSPVPPKQVKAVKAKMQKKETTQAIKSKTDTAALFVSFKTAKMVNPFKETVKDYKRFNAVCGSG
jgi:hypothetical protein